MDSPEDSALWTGSKLSTVLRRKPEFVDELALCLDREMRLIPNWKHLAREMRVDEDVVERLEQYRDHSPTIRLFDYLGVTQPRLTIQELTHAMREIGRNDLYGVLTTKAGSAGYEGYEKVQEVIASQPGLLDDIALALDGTSLVLANWYNLAIQFSVPRKDCWKFERLSTQNPTNELFQYLESTCPQMTLKELKETLFSMRRIDLLDFLNSQNLEDEVLLKDVMTPGSEILQTVADKLNRELPAVENWRHLASKLKIPAEVIRKCGESGQKRQSPTKEIMKWLTTRLPDTTLKEVLKALDKMQRNDASQIIKSQFPDTIDAPSERFDSSLHDSFSSDLPINNPTGETFSTRFKKKSGSFLPKQVAGDVEQNGHCGTLPDRTYLVGRDDTCEQIITLLTSNKAAKIVAPPGYGKTSVVVEVAHKMIDKGKFAAYVKPRGVACAEDLGSKIIEAFGEKPGEDTIKETLICIRSLKPKNVVLIIENIDNLLHLEDEVNREEYPQESDVYCTKMRGKYKKEDFLTFLKDIGQSPNIHLILTSRETVDFSLSFPMELIELQPLNDEDSATLFIKRDKSLDSDCELVKDLVRVCGGIPLIICTVLAILKKENPQNFARRLSTSSLNLLVKELDPDFIANEDRIDKCLQVCFNRLSQENQDVLVMMSTFPHRFTQEQFLAVSFKTSIGPDLRTCMNCLKHSTLVRFDRRSCYYSLHPFIRDFFSLKPKHKEAKSIFIRHYSDLAVTMCKQFLTRDSKSAIQSYMDEKDNIREAMTWCGDNHPELDQETREHCIHSFNKSAVFLAKMMRKQEFESLFCKLSYRCRYDMPLYSACLTNIGMKIVLSCTCTPHICVRALYRAKYFLSRADEIQSSLAAFDDATRAQCLSKLGFCLVREGHYNSGYDFLNRALTLRKKLIEHSAKDKDKVMLAACHNDLAASQMLQRKHMVAIETIINFVLPDYESILGDHPFVATTLSWIGSSYQALRDYDNAIKFNKRALEIRERLLGRHQETARSLFDVGTSLTAKMEYESALENFEKAGAMQEEVLDTHEELIHTHQAKSIVLSGLGREEEAKTEMELADECANRLESLEVSLEVIETSEEAGMVTITVTPPAEERAGPSF